MQLHHMLTESYFRHSERFCSSSFRFKAKLVADVLSFQVCHCLGMAKLQLH